MGSFRYVDSATQLLDHRRATVRHAADLFSDVRRPTERFRRHPILRYDWALSILLDRRGRHLDLGVGDGVFLEALTADTELECIGADPHAGYLRTLRGGSPALRLVQVESRGRIPLRSCSVASVTMLDVLEHTADESKTLAEVCRVLEPGGILLLSVPAKHLFSFLDPDNAKFRFPRFHRAVYTLRFGKERYVERFVDDRNGLRGDMAWSRCEHTNYRPTDLFARMAAAGLEVVHRDGAHLFSLLFYGPRLLAPRWAERGLDVLLVLDGRRFCRGSLFVVARRPTS